MPKEEKYRTCLETDKGICIASEPWSRWSQSWNQKSINIVERNVKKLYNKLHLYKEYILRSKYLSIYAIEGKKNKS